MPDWRWVTQVQHSPSPGNVLPPTINGMWLDFDGLDSIMPLPSGRYNSANTRLGWLTDTGWHYIFVAEQIDPHDMDDLIPLRAEQQQPTTHERTTHADSAMEPTHPT
jgi:hypothetical protein